MITKDNITLWMKNNNLWGEGFLWCPCERELHCSTVYTFTCIFLYVLDTELRHRLWVGCGSVCGHRLGKKNNQFYVPNGWSISRYLRHFSFWLAYRCYHAYLSLSPVTFRTDSNTFSFISSSRECSQLHGLTQDMTGITSVTSQCHATVRPSREGDSIFFRWFSLLVWVPRGGTEATACLWLPPLDTLPPLSVILSLTGSSIYGFSNANSVFFLVFSAYYIRDVTGLLSFWWGRRS